MGTLANLVVKLGLDRSDYDRGLQDVTKDAKAAKSGGGLLGGLFSIGGTVATAGLAAGAVGVTALTGAIAGGISKANEWADVIDSMGDALGTSTAEGAGLAVMMRTIGGDTGDLTKQLVKMAAGLEDGKGGLGSTGKVIDSLGVSIFDTNGKMRSTTQIFGDVATKLASMPDGLQKSALMMDLFGKSGSAMSDTINAAANGGIQNAIEKSKALGLAMGDEAATASIEFGKSMNEVKMIGEGLFVTLGSELLPILTPLIKQFAEWAISVMPQVIKAIKDLVAFGKNDAVPWVLDLWRKTQDFAEALQKFFKPAFDNIQMVFKLFSLAFQGDWEGFGKQLRKIIDTAIGQIKDLFKQMWTTLVTTNWGEVAHNIGEGLVNGIIGIKDWVIGAVIDLGGSILAAIKGFLGIASESKVMRDQVGKEMGRGTISGYRAALAGMDPPVFSLAGAGAGRAVNVALDYRPMYSFADEHEAKERLLPIITEGVRKELARTK